MDPQYEQWSNDTKKFFLEMLTRESMHPGEMPPENFFESVPLARIVLRRISVLKLPLKFNFFSLVFFIELSGNPGKAIIGLIDLLNKYKLHPSSEIKNITQKTFLTCIMDIHILKNTWIG